MDENEVQERPCKEVGTTEMQIELPISRGQRPLYECYCCVGSTYTNRTSLRFIGKRIKTVWDAPPASSTTLPTTPIPRPPNVPEMTGSPSVMEASRGASARACPPPRPSTETPTFAMTASVTSPGANRLLTSDVCVSAVWIRPRTNLSNCGSPTRTRLPGRAPSSVPAPMRNVPYGDERNDDMTGAVMPCSSSARCTRFRRASFSSRKTANAAARIWSSARSSRRVRFSDSRARREEKRPLPEIVLPMRVPTFKTLEAPARNIERMLPPESPSIINTKPTSTVANKRRRLFLLVLFCRYKFIIALHQGFAVCIKVGKNDACAAHDSGQGIRRHYNGHPEGRREEFGKPADKRPSAYKIYS